MSTQHLTDQKRPSQGQRRMDHGGPRRGRAGDISPSATVGESRSLLDEPAMAVADADLVSLLEQFNQMQATNPEWRVPTAAPGGRVAPSSPPAEARPGPPQAARLAEALTLIPVVRLAEVLFPNLEPEIDHEAVWLLFQIWLNECGDPQDAVERMLCEMVLLNWHAAAKFLSRLAATTVVEHIAILSAAAGRLQAEYRRSVQALADYRAKRMVVGTVPSRPRSKDLNPDDPTARKCPQDAQSNDDCAAS